MMAEWCPLPPAPAAMKTFEMCYFFCILIE